MDQALRQGDVSLIANRGYCYTESFVFHVFKLCVRLISQNLLNSIAQSGCTEGDIRLVGGATDREGDVQICRQGVWGYVCHDSWSENEARVICQQLNYSTSCERVYIYYRENFNLPVPF